MKVRIRRFDPSEPSHNAAQERVRLRLTGQLSTVATEAAKLREFDDPTFLQILRGYVGDDPDAREEILCNGTLKRLYQAIAHGSEVAAEALVLLGQEDGLRLNSTILDDETRPRPYWVEFFSGIACHRVLLRYMRPKERGKGKRANFEVGFTLWGASIVLSKELILGMDILASKSKSRILELGSGLGLCGLVASQIWPSSRVWLTDFHPDVVENCRINIALNDLNNCRALQLDWLSIPDSLDDVRQFDLILASDVVCQLEDNNSIASVLDAYLEPNNGIAIFCLGSSDSRYGVSEFVPTLEDRGYRVQLLSETKGAIDDWVSTVDKQYEELVGIARSYLLFLVTRAM